MPRAAGARPVTDKGTGEELAEAGVASQADVDRAVRSAKAAQPGWAALAYDERAGLLRRVARLLEDRGAEIAELIVRETGGIPGKADYEVGAAQDELYEAAALASRATAEVLPSHNTGKLSLIQRVPVGVVAAITPWNFPVVLGFRVVAPALALGNTVILKPAPETPVTGALLMAELFAEAGAPAGGVSRSAGRRRHRQAARGPPRREHDPLHGLVRGRPADRDSGRRRLQARLPRAGRQQRVRRARRRRRRRGRHGRRVVGLPLLGPDLHHRRAPHRRPRAVRRVRRQPRRPRTRHRARGPERRRCWPGSDDLRAPGRARRRNRRGIGPNGSQGGRGRARTTASSTARRSWST